MIRHQNKTNFPPAGKAVMVWDGECGFCQYWIIKWKTITGEKINYKTFQMASQEFPDIPKENFQKAVQLIEPGGAVYGGAAAAYRSLYIINRYTWPYQFYSKSEVFKKINDALYHFVATHRDLFLKITWLFFGKNPKQLKPYWLLYFIMVIFVIIFILMEL